MTLDAGAALTPLVGRERELSAIESRLASGARLITLSGPGGSGKTRLAREVFERRRPHETDTYFLDLVGVLDAGLVPAEIAAGIGAIETSDLDAAGVVLAAFRDRSAVLVLDNLEELTGAKDYLVGLLRGAPKLQMIATSRIPLGIPGEVEFQVPPLQLPQGDTAADVEASPAGTLFLERARAVGRLDAIDESTAKAIAELCRRLDGLPLALELAAARTRIMPPAAIVRHLNERTSGLLAKAGEADGRHESLDTVLSWSIDLLESNEREALSAVAICPGGFDLAIAEALVPDLNVLQAIDVLATHGLLLQRSEVEGEPWYQLLETIRSAAIQRAAEEATSAYWRRLATHLSERIAGSLEAYLKMDEVDLRRLDALLDNVRAVLDWTEIDDPALNLSIAARFAWYWSARGRSREGIPRLRVAIASNPAPSSDLAMALNGLAAMERDSSRPHETRLAAAEAVRIARIVGDTEREVDGLSDLVMYAGTPDPESSTRLQELLPTVEHPAMRYLCLSALAWAEGLASGFSEEVISQFRDAEIALSGTPYRRFQSTAAGNLAQIYLYVHRPLDAHEASTRALVALKDAGPDILCWVYSLHATAASGAGLVSEASMSLRLALNLASGRMGLPAEVTIAAVAVLAASGQPLLAAKVWGAASAGVARGSFVEADHGLAEELLLAARRATDPVSFDVAHKSGQKADPAQLIIEVVAHLDATSPTGGPARPNRLLHGTLTPRELEVLALVGAGKSDGDIAALLFISSKTASVHVSNAKAKLGVDSRLEAALWARARGLVDDI